MNHIVYCLDKSYQQHFGVSLTSLLLNHADNTDLTIHVVIDDPQEDFLQKLGELTRIFKAKIEVHQLRDEVVKSLQNKTGKRNRYTTHISTASLFRLALGDILSTDIKKVLYLDSDTIVLSSPKDLFDIDLGENTIAGVHDFSTANAARLNLPHYINSGVMIMDIEKWRDQDLFNKCLGILVDRSEDVMFLDQCAINIAVANRIKILDNIWNRQVKIRTPVPEIPEEGIVHYITKNKPWQEWYFNPLGEKYWDYLKVSPWRDASAQKAKSLEEKRFLAKKCFDNQEFRKAAIVLDSIVQELIMMTKNKRA